MSIMLNEDFFKVCDDYDPVKIIAETLPITVVPTHGGKFEPKFLHELVDSVYGNYVAEAKDALYHQLRTEDGPKGSFWEQVLEKHMPFTKRHINRRQKGSDFLDGTDAKFAGGARYSADGTVQATISGVENKTGTLRVCICAWGQHLHQVYFMLIPYSEYSTWKSPMKITLRNTKNPIGDKWNKYRCSFQDVTQPGV